MWVTRKQLRMQDWVCLQTGIKDHRKGRDQIRFLKLYKQIQQKEWTIWSKVIQTTHHLIMRRLSVEAAANIKDSKALIRPREVTASIPTDQHRVHLWAHPVPQGSNSFRVSTLRITSNDRRRVVMEGWFWIQWITVTIAVRILLVLILINSLVALKPRIRWLIAKETNFNKITLPIQNHIVGSYIKETDLSLMETPSRVLQNKTRCTAVATLDLEIIIKYKLQQILNPKNNGLTPKATLPLQHLKATPEISSIKIRIAHHKMQVELTLVWTNIKREGNRGSNFHLTRIILESLIIQLSRPINNKGL